MMRRTRVRSMADQHAVSRSMAGQKGLRFPGIFARKTQKRLIQRAALGPTMVDNGTGGFTGAPPKKLAQFIIDDYLPAKVANMMGYSLKKGSDDSWVIRVPAKYGNDEGVIKGYDQIKGLRVDLQKAQSHGGNTYATFQVQWGTGSDGKTGGAFGGVLMRVDNDFTLGDLKAAMAQSFATQTYWRLDP